MKTAKNLDSIQEKEHYALELRKLDELLAQLLPQINQENTLVIITAEQGYQFTLAEEDVHHFSAEQIQVPLLINWKGIEAEKQDKLTSHQDLLPTLMTLLFNVKNSPSDYSEGMNLFAGQERNWALVANYRWNVIIAPDGTQYQVDNKGNYQKYDHTYQKQSSERPPLGLFLEVFNQRSQFFDK